MLCQLEQDRPFARVELESRGDALKEQRRYLDVAPLLEPRVPGDADADELRDFLPTQTGRASPGPGGEPYILRLGSTATFTDEDREILSCFGALQACHLSARQPVGDRHDHGTGRRHNRTAACYSMIRMLVM